jgi:hypothetical protein
MIRTTRTEVANASLLRALLLSAAIAVGFVAGQVAPDVASLLSAPGAAQVAPAQPGVLGPADDYAIRHRLVAPLTTQDDYATRH